MLFHSDKTNQARNAYSGDGIVNNTLTKLLSAEIIHWRNLCNNLSGYYVLRLEVSNTRKNRTKKNDMKTDI